jgi:hypothetical protein
MVDQPAPIFPTAPPVALPAPPPQPSTPPERGRGLRRVTAGLLALQLPFAAAALVVQAGDGDGPPDLAAAADRTEAVGSARFEMVMSFSGEGEHFELPMFRGEEAGGRSHMVMDLAAMADALGEPSPFPTDDVAMEMYTDGGVLYLRAPMFSAIDDLGGEVPAALAPLFELGDRWGVADLAATGATPEEIAGLTGSSGLDMASGLALLRTAADDLEESGTGEVRGTPVTEFEGSITFGDMLEADGGELSMLEGMFPADVAGIDPAEILDAMSSIALDFEVAVDDDGLVRRVAFSFDESFFEAMGEGLDLPAGGDVPDIEMEMAIELFDLDDPSITVELPVVEDPVDLNPWLLAMADEFD